MQNFFLQKQEKKQYGCNKNRMQNNKKIDNEIVE